MHFVSFKGLDAKSTTLRLGGLGGGRVEGEEKKVAAVTWI